MFIAYGMSFEQPHSQERIRAPDYARFFLRALSINIPLLTELRCIVSRVKSSSVPACISTACEPAG